MGNRQDDRSSRMGTRNDGRQGGSGGRDDEPRAGRGRDGGAPPPQRGEPGRVFDRDQDMGGSRWSGASGRGGYEPRASGPGGGYPGRPGEGDPRREPGRGGYDPYDGYGRYPHQEGGYRRDRDYANFSESGYAHEGRHEEHEEGSFLTEDSPGHVPNQRWSGGYGGDRDRNRIPPGYEAALPPSGRGFTGNDFGGLPRRRDRAFGAPADVGPRHFGNDVDRGGRMGPGGGESTTGRGYWGWESDRAGGINVGQMGGREGWNLEGQRGGYGFQGTDMGMGAPDEERGPHYGKGPKGYKRSDERTREDVCDAIAHQGHIDASDVDVKVGDGIVTLSGTVMHRHDKRKLEHLVERCRGVREVHNELRLKRADADKDAGRSAPGKQAKQPQQAQQGQQGKPADMGPASGNGTGTQNGKTARS